MGLPDTEEADRFVAVMPEAQVKEWLSNHEIARYEEYKALRLAWDETPSWALRGGGGE